MIKLQKIFTLLKQSVKNHPKYIIVIFAIGGIVLFGIAECIRARIYISSSNDYKKSAKVMTLLDSVDRLGKLTDAKPSAYFCKVDFDVVSQDINPAINPSQSNTFTVESLVDEIRTGLKDIKPVPVFSSLFEFLPQPKKARAISEEMQGAVANVELLTSSDVRSDYCLQLYEALSSIYFLQDLQKPEGVSALSVGQVENFQVIVSRLQDNFLSVKFPAIYEKQHTDFLKLLQKVAIDLRQDDNNYRQFSRTIEQNVVKLEEILAEIENLSGDLGSKPKDIAIQMNFLRMPN